MIDFAAIARRSRGVVIALAIVVSPMGWLHHSPLDQAGNAVGQIQQLTGTYSIASSADDVNEDGTSFFHTASSVWLGTGGNAAASYTGLRFQGVGVPQGATILSARLQIYQATNSWIAMDFVYAAENIGNSPPFSTSSRPSQRALTATTVTHSSNTQWVPGAWLDLDDITPVIQPVINRADWVSGNALSVILRGTGSTYGRKQVPSYDGAPTLAVRLVVTYSSTNAPTLTPGATATPTRTATPTLTTAAPTATVLPSATPTAAATEVPFTCFNPDLCLQVRLNSSIVLNQPVEAHLVLTSTGALSNAQVFLFSTDTSRAIVEGQSEWTISGTPGQTFELVTSVRFLGDGWVNLVGQVQHEGDFSDDIEVVQVLNGIGQLNPSATSPVESVQALVTDTTLEQGSAQTGWIPIKSETFEAAWPGTGWSVSPSTLTWDDESYRKHGGTWAAWPAGAGSSGYSPTTGNHYYRNNMNSRMAYGPFDLSDAKVADVSFWLWYQTEPANDYLVLEASTDGSTYQELRRWSGSGATWVEVSQSLSAYLGRNQVWLSWRFVSSASGNSYEGAWVDDIAIRKYVPGMVTLTGTLKHYDRTTNLQPVAHAMVQLLDQDGSTYDVLAGINPVVETNDDGVFTLGPVLNWDADDTATDPLQRRLDLALRVFARNGTMGQVTDFAGTAYQVDAAVSTNQPDGASTQTITLPSGTQNGPAISIFQDLVRTVAYISQAGDTLSPASLRWVRNVTSYGVCGTSCYLPVPPLNGIFISDTNSHAPDVVVHELGHFVMVDKNGFWPLSVWDDYSACLSHGIWDSYNPVCGYSEGWPTFFALAVNQDLISQTYDPCYDWSYAICGPGSVDFETPSAATNGDTVEGRVTAAMLDLFDSQPDGLDQVQIGFPVLWQVMKSVGANWTYRNYYDQLSNLAGMDRHLIVRAVHHNTIYYNRPPDIAVPSSAQIALRGVLAENYLTNATLRTLIVDTETNFDRLTWSVSIAPAQCQGSVDGQGNYDLWTDSNWTGSCTITLQANDTLDGASRTFTVPVVPVVNTLPFVTLGR